MRRTWQIVVWAGVLGLAGGFRVRAAEIPFSSRQTLDSSFTFATTVFCADLDGDGDEDILATANTGNTVAWWNNVDGSGTNWAKRIISSTFNLAFSVAAADLDADGHLDVVATAGSGNRVTWWQNLDGTGTNLVERNIDASYASARGLFVDDVNGDGRLDVVATSFNGNNISWWQNQGFGSNWIQRFVQTEFTQAFSVVVADLNGNGRRDVIGCSKSGGIVAWWENLSGLGTNWLRRNIDATFANANGVQAADLDGDGDVDVIGVAGAAGVGSVAWWENVDGTGTNWAKRVVDASSVQGFSVRAMDLDQDGDLDLLGAAEGTLGPVAWWENVNGLGTSWIKRTIDTVAGARSAVAADLNGDGDLDVAGVGNSGVVAAWDNRTLHRSAVFCATIGVDDSVNGAHDVQLADLDGDGKPDLLGSARDGNEIVWWRNTSGVGTQFVRHVIESGIGQPHAVRAHDVDGDGDLDVVAALASDHELAWWENTDGSGTAWTRHVVEANLDGAISVAVADFDRDGDLDIAGGAFWANHVYWWENVGGRGTNWVRRTIDFYVSPRALLAADVDGDGRMDVGGVSLFNGTVTWWRNTNGLGTAWTRLDLSTNYAGPRDLDAADLDGDGDLDLLTAGYTTNVVTWWENVGGSGTNWVQRDVAAGGGPTMLRAGDLDGDGDLDLVESRFDGHAVVWWENLDGAATAWQERPVAASFSNAEAVAVGDLNRDGRLDLAGAASGLDAITWWPNGGGPFALATVSTAPAGLRPGATTDVFKITAQHRGRAGDSDAEWSELALRLEKSGGAAMTTADATNILARLALHLDDGSGVFESGADALVAVQSSFVLTDGSMVIPLPDGDPLVQCAAITARTYFVTATLRTNAGNQSPDLFRLVHLTESGGAFRSGAEDRTNDIPLRLECAANTASGFIQVETEADLGLFKVGAPAVLTQGSNVTYTLTVTNLGPERAISVVVTDSLPAGVMFNPDGSSPECLGSSETVVCNLGILSNQAGRSVAIGIWVIGSTTGELTNRAVVSTSSVDTNPANNSAEFVFPLPDYDGDGIADFADDDDDNDGIPDWFEILHGLNPTNAADALVDTDLDSYLNLEEYIAFTHPTNGQSYLRFEFVDLADGVSMVWSSSGARVYGVDYSPDVVTGGWTQLESSLPGNNNFISVTDTNAADRMNYRIRVWRP